MAKLRANVLQFEYPKEIILRYDLPLRAGILLVTAAAILACIPPAIRAIPGEATGMMLLYLLPPGILVYASWFVFSYRIRIQEDGVFVEAIPNPFAPRFHCRYQDISRIEKGENCLYLDIYLFRKAGACQIPNMNLLEGGPLRIVEEFRKRIPEDRFFYRSVDRVKTYWRGYSLLDGLLLVLGAGWATLLLLHGGGMSAFFLIQWPTVESNLFLAILLLLAVEGLLLRAMNHDT
jgi:hypothetical protein